MNDLVRHGDIASSSSAAEQAVAGSEREMTECEEQESVPRPGHGPGAPLILSRESFPLPVRLWMPVVLRIVAGASLLCAVAYLGRRSRDLETYGQAARIVVQPKDVTPKEIEPSRGNARDDAPQRTLAAVSSPEEPPPCPRPDGKEEAPAGITSEGKIILNEASEKDLTELPGVGASRAAAIVALRERLGSFTRVTDLLRVRGIGYRTLSKIKPLVVLERPEEKPVDVPAEPPPSASSNEREAGPSNEDNHRQGETDSSPSEPAEPEKPHPKAPQPPREQVPTGEGQAVAHLSESN